MFMFSLFQAFEGLASLNDPPVGEWLPDLEVFQSQGGYTGSHQRRRSQQRQEILDTKSRNLPAFLEETLGKEEVAKQSLVDRQQKLLEFRKKKEDRASAAAAVAKKKPWGFAKVLSCIYHDQIHCVGWRSKMESKIEITSPLASDRNYITTSSWSF